MRYKNKIWNTYRRTTKTEDTNSGVRNWRWNFLLYVCPKKLSLQTYGGTAQIKGRISKPQTFCDAGPKLGMENAMFNLHG
jgi:hypothetical protein